MKKIIISMAFSAVCLLIGFGSFAVNDVTACLSWGRENSSAAYQWARRMPGFCRDFMFGDDYDRRDHSMTRRGGPGYGDGPHDDRDDWRNERRGERENGPDRRNVPSQPEPRSPDTAQANP